MEEDTVRKLDPFSEEEMRGERCEGKGERTSVVWAVYERDDLFAHLQQTNFGEDRQPTPSAAAFVSRDLQYHSLLPRDPTLVSYCQSTHRQTQAA